MIEIASAFDITAALGSTGLFLRLAAHPGSAAETKTPTVCSSTLLPKRHQPEPVHARAPERRGCGNEVNKRPRRVLGDRHPRRTIHRTASLPGPSTVATMTRTHLADSWSDSVAVDMPGRYFDDAYACAWRVRCFMHRSASNQTSLAASFRQGRLRSWREVASSRSRLRNGDPGRLRLIPPRCAGG